MTPENPPVSDLQLDMGVRLPLSAVRPGTPVNGQHLWSVRVGWHAGAQRQRKCWHCSLALIPRSADTRA